MTEEKENLTEKKCCSSSNWVLPLILVLGGVVLLFNNFGAISWTFWNNLWPFWPVGISICGLELLAGKNALARLITFLITIVVIVAIFTFALAKTNASVNNFINRYLPQWENIKNVVPEPSDNPLPFKGDRKIFRCDPQTGECKAIYK